jgi:hypothetical protein
MKFGLSGLALTGCVTLIFTLPVVAQESAAQIAPAVSQYELPATMTHDHDWRVKGDGAVRKTPKERDMEMWSLALLGPAMMLILVTALGLTITVRSLRDDVRRQHSLNFYRRLGAKARANQAIN